MQDIESARSQLVRKKIEKQINTRTAYRQLFCDDNGRLKPEAQAVMRDLAKFCHANRSGTKVSPKTGMVDPNATLLAEGRREVFLRVLNHVNVDDKVFNRLLTQYYEEMDL